MKVEGDVHQDSGHMDRNEHNVHKQHRRHMPSLLLAQHIRSKVRTGNKMNSGHTQSSWLGKGCGRREHGNGRPSIPLSEVLLLHMGNGDLSHLQRMLVLELCRSAQELIQ